MNERQVKRERVVFLTVLALAAFSCLAAEELPQRLFRERWQERLPDRAVPEVRYELDPSLSGDEVRVCVKGGKAVVSAGRKRGLVLGAGCLLKAIRWRENGFDLADGEYGVRPAKSLRMAYLARHFRNWYMEAPAREVCRYIEDLALDGINAFSFQFSLAEVDQARETPEFVRTFEATSRQMLATVNDLDCDFCDWAGGNQLSEDAPEEFRAVPSVGYGRSQLGFNACPAKPGALKAMLEMRRKNVARLNGARVGGLIYWPYDEGGCGCTNCHPWGANGYVGLIERLHDFYVAACPSAKHIVSTWMFDRQDYDGFWNYLSRQDWIDYVLCDAHGDFPRYPLEHPLPGRTKLVTFPEISMYGRFPWGGYGAIALPRRFERLFRQVEKVADGFVCYSEGIFEDVNKAVVTRLYLDPKTAPEEIVRKYARYHLAGTDPSDFVRLVDLMEANHLGVEFSSDRAKDARRLAERMDASILPSLRTSWRWRLLYVRALFDAALAETPGFDPVSIGPHSDVAKPEGVRPFVEELARLYHAERQAEAVKAGKSKGWTCPRMHGGHEWKNQ